MEKITEEQLNKAVEELLNKLNERQRLVVSVRYGLDNGKSRTLEFIGNKLGVSRERIRQIEQGAIALLKKSKKSQELNKILSFVEEELFKRGGFLDKGTFKEIIFNGELNQELRNKLAFLLSSSSMLKYQKDTVPFQGIWYLPKYKQLVKKIKPLHTELVSYFKQNKKEKTSKELLKIINSEVLFSGESDFFTEENKENRLNILLRGSNVIGKNIMNEWGLNSWAIISQKYAREKAYLIFRKYRKPLHFRELTEYINKHWQDKKALPQTVHNVIIKYDEFIFVRSGTYKLKD